MSTTTPRIGHLVQVRGQHWVVADVTPPADADGRADGEPDGAPAAARTLVRLHSVEEGGYGRELTVVWEAEPGRQVRDTRTLPEVTRERFDSPERLAAFLDALRWSAVTSADTSRLQAPFRSGVKIEDYQLEPVARALKAPRVNLLLADDVGLGKTIEAGLTALELILRHRAHRIMVVCPAGLTLKWRDEMAEKFGLDFEIVDAAALKRLRRTHGLAANPFRVFPRTIVSLAWLRGPRVQRLLDEVLPPAGPTERRVFDLLILDEAHHVAPAAPTTAYAVDSQQTRVVRRLAAHFEHRLFLTATPHNGYPESFTALLEMLDPQRFARGVSPDPTAQEEVVVRRLKDDIVDARGLPVFPGRAATPIVVDYPAREREVHEWLTAYAAQRRARAGKSRAAARSVDLVTLLLKKRLFSSPRAFAQTVAVHLDTLRRRATTRPRPPGEQVPAWLDSWFAEPPDATLDDDALDEAEQEALTRSGRLQPAPTGEEIALLERMRDWALTHEARPDAKARALLDYLAAVCRPDGTHWSNERVVVFTEYRDTQQWLRGLLAQAGLDGPGGERLALLHGGMTVEERERLRLAFQKSPAEHSVRVLLATDAASEGIDLQRHCHRIVNYDIPFNPNKLEQRIGRLDRYGQRERVDVRHFIGAGWERAAPYSYEADLEFLSRVARKVTRMEEDLGEVNPVLAEAIQRHMTGRLPAGFDVERATAARPRPRRRGRLRADRNVGEQARRLRDQLATSVRELHVAPANIGRVVATALALANQQPLRPDPEAADPAVLAVPTLTGSWARVSQALPDPLTGETRPVTFDPAVVAGRDDVVLAHLGHPLVALSTGLLRAALWGGAGELRRVTAVVSDDPELEACVLAAFARLVVVGRDGVELHEEIIHAGGWVRDGLRFSRIGGVEQLGGILDRALDAARITPAAPVVRERLAAAWPHVDKALLAALAARGRVRTDSLKGALARRRDDEARRIVDRLDRFAAGLRAALAEPDDGQLELPLTELPERERRQREHDRRAWRERLDGLDAEKEREVAAITRRYEIVDHHLFPAAVVFVVPEWEASR